MFLVLLQRTDLLCLTLPHPESPRTNSSRETQWTAGGRVWDNSGRVSEDYLHRASSWDSLSACLCTNSRVPGKQFMKWRVEHKHFKKTSIWQLVCLLCVFGRVVCIPTARVLPNWWGCFALSFRATVVSQSSLFLLSDIETRMKQSLNHQKSKVSDIEQRELGECPFREVSLEKWVCRGEARLVDHRRTPVTPPATGGHRWPPATEGRRTVCPRRRAPTTDNNRARETI